MARNAGMDLMRMAGNELVRARPGARLLAMPLCYAAEPLQRITPFARALHDSLSHFGPLPRDYVPGGPEFFGRMIDAPTYPLIKAEDATVLAHRREFGDIFRDKCVFVAGVGEGEKIYQRFRDCGTPAHAALNDVSRGYLDIAESKIASLIGKRNVSTNEADFTKSAFAKASFWKDLKALGLPILFYFEGSTIKNFSPSTQMQIMENIAEHCDECLIAADLTRDPDIMDGSYGSKIAHLAAPFFLRGFVDALARLRYDLDPSTLHEDFSYSSTFDREKGCQRVGIVSQRSQSFALSPSRVFLLAENFSSSTMANNTLSLTSSEFILSTEIYRWLPEDARRTLTAGGHRIAQVMSFSKALDIGLPDDMMPFRSEGMNRKLRFNWYHLTR